MICRRGEEEKKNKAAKTERQVQNFRIGRGFVSSLLFLSFCYLLLFSTFLGFALLPNIKPEKPKPNQKKKKKKKEMGESKGASKLRNAARKIILACGSFSRQSHVDPIAIDSTTTSNNLRVPHSPSPVPSSPQQLGGNNNKISEIVEETESSSISMASKNLCAICLEPLSYTSTSSKSQAIFTAQCSHAFHFGCISSNVRHGSVTCPICRAHWTQLPRNLYNLVHYSNAQSINHRRRRHHDPALRILDDSIATFRVHRRSFLRSARYDDDDPIDPLHNHTPPNHPGRLLFSLIHVVPHSPQNFQYSPCATSASSSSQVSSHSSNNSSSIYHWPTAARGVSSVNITPSSSSSTSVPYLSPLSSSASNHNGSRGKATAYLSVKMANQQATDLVIIATPNGPHLRLLKQSMALTVFSLRNVDRLAIVAYSSAAAARVFPLRRMTSYGKRTALQVIDRLFYMGQADPVEGLKKGLKILEDRSHKNPRSCILHLSDSPTRSNYHHHHHSDGEIPIHRFHVGFGVGTWSSSGLVVMHEFEELLARILMGGVVRETQLWIGDDRDEEARIPVRLGEVRSGEERRIPLALDLEADDMASGGGGVYVGFSYIDEADECITTGETLVLGVEEKRETLNTNAIDDAEAAVAARTSGIEIWDYHDPYMARRWAKHLHGYRL